MANADILSLVVRGTIAASIAICAVFAFRRPAREAFGAHISYASWLLVPAAVIASFIPRRVVLPAPSESAAVAPIGSLGSGGPIPSTIERASSSGFALPDTSTLILLIWLVGVLASLVAVAIDHRRMVVRLGLRRDGGMYRAAGENAGPAVVGVVLPRIVIPAGFEERYDSLERALVLAHEREHIRAGDVQINALAAAAQCLNWFNPLFYLARSALRVDQELACDERVMRRHAASRRTYAEAMLKTQLSHQAIALGCHWPALGAKALGERINMLRRPAPSRLVRAVGAFACAGAVVTGSAVAWAAQEPEVSYAEVPQSKVGPAASAMGSKLVEALQEGDFGLARMLISTGADVNHYQPGDGTPLTMAARAGNADFARLLLDAGADVNRAAPGDGNPLIVAADAGRLDLVELFVKAGANVNGYVYGDETPLIAAARENRLPVADYLIKAGADVDLAVKAPALRGFERRSPLGMAERNGHTEMIRMLREHGAEK